MYSALAVVRSVYIPTLHALMSIYAVLLQYLHVYIAHLSYYVSQVVPILFVALYFWCVDVIVDEISANCVC